MDWKMSTASLPPCFMVKRRGAWSGPRWHTAHTHTRLSRGKEVPPLLLRWTRTTHRQREPLTSAQRERKDVDAKGYRVDVKGYSVDAKGYRVDVKDEDAPISVFKGYEASTVAVYKHSVSCSSRRVVGAGCVVGASFHLEDGGDGHVDLHALHGEGDAGDEDELLPVLVLLVRLNDAVEQVICAAGGDQVQRRVVIHTGHLLPLVLQTKHLQRGNNSRMLTQGRGEWDARPLYSRDVRKTATPR
eukprot:3194975-Pyramimonas_sp.AAC.1